MKKNCARTIVAVYALNVSCIFINLSLNISLHNMMYLIMLRTVSSSLFEWMRHILFVFPEIVLTVCRGSLHRIIMVRLPCLYHRL